jgi:hypothetical protein
MRAARLLLLLFALGACAAREAPPRDEPEPSEPLTVDIDGLAERFRRGDPAAEVRLAAAGEPGLAVVRPLLLSEDPELRLRSLSLLLSAGEDIALTERERVDLLLFDVMRDSPQPWATLRALGRLRGMGEAEREVLTEAARGNARADTAQRLLRRWTP